MDEPRRKVNLGREVDSIRNRLRPGRGEKRSMKKSTIWAALVMVGITVAYLLFPPQWDQIPERLSHKITLERQGYLDPVVHEDRMSDLVAPPPVAGEPAPAPSETVPVLAAPDLGGEPAAEQVATHPVTPGGEPEAPPPAAVVETAAAPPAPAPVSRPWRVRLSICLQAGNCAAYVKELAGKGIDAETVRGSAELMTFRATAGPWPTETQEREAADALKRRGIDTVPVRADERRYLVTPPLGSKEEAVKVAAAMEEAGYPGKVSAKREPREVGKVYLTERFAGRDGADGAAAKLKDRGIASLVESTQE